MLSNVGSDFLTSKVEQVVQKAQHSYLLDTLPPRNVSADEFKLTSKKSTKTAGSKTPNKNPGLPYGTLIDASSDKLLPGFAKKYPFNLQRFRPIDLVLCHMTDHLSPTGKVLSPLEAGLYCRQTTHFSLNHVVGENAYGQNWANKEKAIFLPMSEGMRLNGKPASCQEIDTYWTHSLNYNSRQGVVLVKQPGIPSGQFKVLDPKEAGYHADANMLVLGTSQPLHQVGKRVITKMGRTPLEPGQLTWGSMDLLSFNKQSAQQRQAFKLFLNREHLEEKATDCATDSYFEKSLMSVGALSQLGKNSWVHNGQDYRGDILEKLKQLKHSKYYDEQQSLHLNSAIDIIENATTPSEASLKLCSLLKVSHLIDHARATGYEEMLPMFQELKSDPEQRAVALSYQPTEFEKKELNTIIDASGEEQVGLIKAFMLRQGLQRHQMNFTPEQKQAVTTFGETIRSPIPIINGVGVKSSGLTKSYRDALLSPVAPEVPPLPIVKTPSVESHKASQSAAAETSVTEPIIDNTAAQDLSRSPKASSETPPAVQAPANDSVSKLDGADEFNEAMPKTQGNRVTDKFSIKRGWGNLAKTDTANQNSNSKTLRQKMRTRWNTWVKRNEPVSN